MVIDARGHEVPDGSDPWGYREDMEALSESIVSVRTVANQAGAVAAVADLVAAGINPAGTLWWFADSGLIYLRTAAGGWARIISQADSLLPVVAYSGVTGITGTANKIRSKVITYPVGRFTRTPPVFLQIGTGTTNPSLTNTEMWVSSRKLTSFQLNVNRNNNTTVSAVWMAVYYGGAPEVPDFPDDELVTRALTDGDDGQHQTVTCRTAGCLNEGVPIDVAYNVEGDEPPEVECGVCGQPITDIVREGTGS